MAYIKPLQGESRNELTIENLWVAQWRQCLPALIVGVDFTLAVYRPPFMTTFAEVCMGKAAQMLSRPLYVSRRIDWLFTFVVMLTCIGIVISPPGGRNRAPASMLIPV